METEQRTDVAERRVLGIAAFLVAVLGAVLFYTLPFAARHLRMPAGDDALFYVVGLRSVARLGLTDPQLAVRPAFPLVGSVLATVTGSNAWTVAVAAPIAFAAGTGLASAAVAARWRLRGPGLALFAFLVAASGVVARLVAGKVENGMALWLMAAALAVAVWAGGPRDPSSMSDDRGPPAWIASGAPVAALASALMLVEWPLAVTFLAILVFAWAVSWSADRLRGADPARIAASEPALRLLLLGSLAGLGVGALVAFVWNGAGPGAGIQNLPPGYRYGGRLRDELSLARPWITGPLVVLGAWVAVGRERRPPALTAVLSVWLAGTVAVLAAGWLGVPGPTYRVLLIALPVALATSAAWLFPLAGPRGWRRSPLDRSPNRLRREILRWGAPVLVVAALVPGVLFWWKATLGTPTTVEQVAEVSAAVRYARSLPGDDPAVLVVSRMQLPFAESLLYGRMVQSVSPPGATPRVLIFVGRAPDALAGRPSAGIGPGEDAVLLDLFRRVGPALASGSPVLSGRTLDPDGYDAAVAAGAATIGGDVVAIARGPAPAAAQATAVRVDAIPTWPRLTMVALLVLVVLTAIGLGWSHLSLASSSPGIRWLLAPAFGAAALTGVALVLVHTGVRPAGGGAWVALGIGLAASGGAWWASRARTALRPPR